MTHKNKSLLIMFIIYAFIIVVGVAVFILLPQLSLIYRLLVADVIMTLVTWILSLILRNASVYDPYWSVIPPAIILGVIIFLNKPAILSIILLFSGLLIWSIRLTYNWATRWTDFNEVDWRYQLMRKKSPKLYFLTNLFGIQLFPTLIVFIQLIAATKFISMSPSMNIFIWIGFILMVGAATIQFFADQQMKEFKEKHRGQKKCIEEGLWKYSRHPNYFGEITLWWGLYIMYFGSTMKFDIYLFAPMMMTALFLFVSIPWMEKKILTTRPEYKDYQQRVSMLIPFIPKEAQTSTQENS
ncbi:MAG: DUF1295 domain-containing protein [Firmicutes bacterium]|nr:DUF1295 domain-containing protein [Bacillota bacterium]